MTTELERLSSLTTDQLLQDLAESSIVAGFPFDPERLRAVGAALFKGWFDEVRDSLCGRLQLEGGTDAESIVRDAAAIMDILLGLNNHLPLATLSVIIAKYGLGNLCAGQGMEGG